MVMGSLGVCVRACVCVRCVRARVRAMHAVHVYSIVHIRVRLTRENINLGMRI